MDSSSNGTINIYDISTPSAPRFVRNQAIFPGISGITFSGLTALGTDYLIGISGNKTGNPATTGHDVVVIDRRDVHNLRRVADYDIIDFDAFQAKALGNLLFVAGVQGGVAIVEANIGKGKVFLFGPEITQRGQTHGTFKLLFNGIYLGSSTPTRM